MIHHIDLKTEFVLIGFHTYEEFKQTKQLCQEKWRSIVLSGELSKMKEIQAKAWVYKAASGYMDYHHDGSIRARPKGKATAKESIAKAMKVQEQQTSHPINYVLVVQK